MKNATVTMPLDEFEDMRNREQFWQDKFNRLYKVVRRYAERDDEGIWRVGEHDCVSLADDLEEYMNDYETETD